MSPRCPARHPLTERGRREGRAAPGTRRGRTARYHPSAACRPEPTGLTRDSRLPQPASPPGRPSGFRHPPQLPPSPRSNTRGWGMPSLPLLRQCQEARPPPGGTHPHRRQKQKEENKQAEAAPPEAALRAPHGGAVRGAGGRRGSRPQHREAVKMSREEEGAEAEEKEAGGRPRPRRSGRAALSTPGGAGGPATAGPLEKRRGGSSGGSRAHAPPPTANRSQPPTAAGRHLPPAAGGAAPHAAGGTPLRGRWRREPEPQPQQGVARPGARGFGPVSERSCASPGQRLGAGVGVLIP